MKPYFFFIVGDNKVAWDFESDPSPINEWESRFDPNEPRVGYEKPHYIEGERDAVAIAKILANRTQSLVKIYLDYSGEEVAAIPFAYSNSIYPLIKLSTPILKSPRK